MDKLIRTASPFAKQVARRAKPFYPSNVHALDNSHIVGQAVRDFSKKSNLPLDSAAKTLENVEKQVSIKPTDPFEKPSPLAKNEAKSPSIQELAAGAFDKLKNNGNSSSLSSELSEASENFLTKLAEQNLAIKKALESYAEKSNDTSTETPLDKSLAQEQESLTSSSRNGKENSESVEISPEEKKDVLDRYGIDQPEKKLYTAEDREIKLHDWKDAVYTQTIYSPEQEAAWLKGFVKLHPEFAGKIDIIEFAAKSFKRNCHGETLGVDFWVDGPDFQKFLDDNCKKIQQGDLYKLTKSEFQRFANLSEAEAKKYLAVCRYDLRRRVEAEKLTQQEADEKYQKGEDIRHSARMQESKDSESYIRQKMGLTQGVLKTPFKFLSLYTGVYGSKYEIYERLDLEEDNSPQIGAESSTKS